MNVYVMTMKGGEYEDKWSSIVGVVSSEIEALKKFENFKDIYAKGKKIDAEWNGDTKLTEQENEQWEFYWDNEDWYLFEIDEYEIDGSLVSRKACYYRKSKGEWEWTT